MEVVFHGLDVELLIGEAEVWSPQKRVTVRNGQDFLSDRWIALKHLQEFSEAVFHRLDVESLISDAEVWSRQKRVIVRKGQNF